MNPDYSPAGLTAVCQPLIGKLLVLPRFAAKRFACTRPWACISIGVDHGDWPRISRRERIDRLRLAFADIKEPKDDLILFNGELARQILEFVDRVWDEIEVLMIHCEAGISRSPAVAAAIAKLKYKDDAAYFRIYRPNTLVYLTLLQAARRSPIR